MNWTNLEIVQDEIAKLEKKFSKQLANPNVSLEFPELYTKSGYLKRKLSKSDLTSIQEGDARKRLYYTIPETGEKIPYSQYQRMQSRLKKAEREARKSLAKEISVDTAILDNFLSPTNWAHYTPLLGQKVSTWLDRIRSKYDNNLRKIVRGLELAANYEIIKEVQLFAYEHNIDTAHLPKLLPFFELAGVQIDQEDEMEAQKISDDWADISATEGIPEEILRQIYEDEDYEEQFD